MTWLAAALVGACGPGSPSTAGDAGQDLPVLTITFENVPPKTPDVSVAVRGTAPNATRVVFLWDPGQVVTATPLFASGEFCADLPLKLNAATTFHVYAQGGSVTSEEHDLMVTQDPTASSPADPTCSHQPTCKPMSATEICGNGVDDDCNGLLDKCDPVCNGGKTCAGLGPGFTCCNAQCIDTSSSIANCGLCGHACASNESCQSGQCVAVTCSMIQCATTGKICCPGQSQCVDLQRDRSNCGTCGRACTGNTYCSKGYCIPCC